MASIIDQIRDLTAKRQALIDQLIGDLRADVAELNNAGFSYELVQATNSPAQRKKRTDVGVIRWSTSITRVTNASKGTKLTKAHALEAVKAALNKLAKEKGVEVPAEVLSAAEQTVADVYSRK